MKLSTDHASWCASCHAYLSAANPGAVVFGRVLCLHCVEVVRLVLLAQVEEDKARER